MASGTASRWPVCICQRVCGGIRSWVTRPFAADSEAAAAGYLSLLPATHLPIAAHGQEHAEDATGFPRCRSPHATGRAAGVRPSPEATPKTGMPCLASLTSTPDCGLRQRTPEIPRLKKRWPCRRCSRPGPRVFPPARDRVLRVRTGPPPSWPILLVTGLDVNVRPLYFSKYFLIKYHIFN
jgi:hypothetical protein